MLDAACAEVAAEMQPGIVYLVGPGTTASRVLHHLGLAGTLLGVDAVLNRRLVGRDLGEAAIAALIGGRKVALVLGVTGGQGFIFGRGNQPLGPQIIRAAGKDNIILLATQGKLQGLEEGRLFLDTGDPDLDRALSGFIRVRIGPRRFALMRLSA
jgi:predicted polyphosphate/ATP-dependent NAD kinase